jgi:hypothetical protein
MGGFGWGEAVGEAWAGWGRLGEAVGEGWVGWGRLQELSMVCGTASGGGCVLLTGVGVSAILRGCDPSEWGDETI